MGSRSTGKNKKTLEDVAARVAQLTGLMSRVHGNLRLEGVDFAGREKALEGWCREREKAYRSMVERGGPDGSRGLDTV